MIPSWIIAVFRAYRRKPFIKRIVIYRDAINEYRWHAQGYNNEILFCSEGYTSKQMARKSVNRLVEALKDDVEVADCVV